MEPLTVSQTENARGEELKLYVIFKRNVSLKLKGWMLIGVTSKIIASPKRRKDKLSPVPLTLIRLPALAEDG